MFSNLHSDFKTDSLKSDSLLTAGAQNHGMVWARRDLNDHLISTPAMGRDTSTRPCAQSPIQPGLKIIL